MKRHKFKVINKIGFILVATLLIAGIWYFENNQSNKEYTLLEKTQQRALLIGQKLIESKFQRKIFTTENSNRGIASDDNFTLLTKEEGKTGRDPWGQPFNYKKLDQKLVIWSAGPNNKLEATDEDIKNAKSKSDDILVSISL